MWFLCHANNGRTFFRFWCFKFNLFFEHVLRCERKGKKPSGKQKEFNSFSRDSVSYYGFLPVIFGSVAFLPFQKKFDCLLTHIVPCLTFNISSYIFKALHCVAQHYKAPFNAHKHSLSHFQSIKWYLRLWLILSNHFDCAVAKAFKRLLDKREPKQKCHWNGFIMKTMMFLLIKACKLHLHRLD